MCLGLVAVGRKYIGLKERYRVAETSDFLGRVDSCEAFCMGEWRISVEAGDLTCGHLRGQEDRNLQALDRLDSNWQKCLQDLRNR